jgi:hypothetical protein
MMIDDMSAEARGDFERRKYDLDARELLTIAVD